MYFVLKWSHPPHQVDDGGGVVGVVTLDGLPRLVKALPSSLRDLCPRSANVVSKGIDQSLQRYQIKVWPGTFPTLSYLTFTLLNWFEIEPHRASSNVR